MGKVTHSTETESVPHRDMLDSRGRVITVLEHLPDNPNIKQIKLPVAVYWSGDKDTYSLDVPIERNFAYEQLLTNANANDLTRYLDKDTLLEVFDDLMLPPFVRAAWLPVIEHERR